MACCCCLKVEKFCFCLGLNAGCIVIGCYLAQESFLLLIGGIAWVDEKKRYSGGDPYEKAAYAVFGFWLLGCSIAVIVGVGKSKAVYLRCASVLMLIPIGLLAADSLFIYFVKKGGFKLWVNIIPLVLSPYFMLVLCSKAAELDDKNRGLIFDRESQCAISPPL